MAGQAYLFPCQEQGPLGGGTSLPAIVRGLLPYWAVGGPTKQRVEEWEGLIGKHVELAGLSELQVKPFLLTTAAIGGKAHLGVHVGVLWLLALQGLNAWMWNDSDPLVLVRSIQHLVGKMLFASSFEKDGF